MFFHEIAGELKTYLDPTGRGGGFVVALVGDTLRDPMTEEEKQMELNDEFNPLASRLSLNMLDQINVVTYHKDEKDGHIYGFMPSWRKDLPKESL